MERKGSLTDAEVHQIRTSDKNAVELAQALDSTYDTVYQAAIGRTYKHVTTPARVFKMGRPLKTRKAV